MQDPNPKHGEQPETERGLSADAGQSRREFLKKAGKFAAYTPPAIMLLMQPSRNAIAHSGRGRTRQDRNLDRLRDHVRDRPDRPDRPSLHEANTRVRELRDWLASRHSR